MWPGNIRQLENVIRKFLILGDPGMIVAELRSKMNLKSSTHAAAIPDIADKPDTAVENTILGQVTKAKATRRKRPQFWPRSTPRSGTANRRRLC